MDEKTAWYLFETTGNIEAYMLYQDLTNGRAEKTGRRKPDGLPHSPYETHTGYSRMGQPPFSGQM
ncbi:MAG: YqzL family protein [Ethanoligenens sp.]|uniref:YqzL family protein n=1 Tax=Ethanoligenens sp. TaxID=2099655 RepID=UPI0039E79A6F